VVKRRGRQPAIDWSSFDSIKIGIWCEARQNELRKNAGRLPLWTLRHERALRPLHEKRGMLGKKQKHLAETRAAIYARWKAGEIDEAAANDALRKLRPAIDKTYADLKKLMLRYSRVSKKIVRGRGKKPHSRLIPGKVVRPWGLEAKILAEASAHFSKEWSRPISKRTVREAWDDLRSILKKS